MLKTRLVSGNNLLVGTAGPESFSLTIAAMIRGPNDGDWDNFLGL
jgi:hypothetical protein